MTEQTYSLDFICLRAPRAPTIASVYVKTSTFHSYLGEPERQFITNECTTLPELEAEIDRLHSELETIKRMAHGTFADKIISN